MITVYAMIGGQVTREKKLAHYDKADALWIAEGWRKDGEDVEIWEGPVRIFTSRDEPIADPRRFGRIRTSSRPGTGCNC